MNLGIVSIQIVFQTTKWDEIMKTIIDKKSGSKDLIHLINSFSPHSDLMISQYYCYPHFTVEEIKA